MVVRLRVNEEQQHQRRAAAAAGNDKADEEEKRRADFVARMMERFEEADADGDGEVTFTGEGGAETKKDKISTRTHCKASYF